MCFCKTGERALFMQPQQSCRSWGQWLCGSFPQSDPLFWFMSSSKSAKGFDEGKYKPEDVVKCCQLVVSLVSIQSHGAMIAMAQQTVWSRMMCTHSTTNLQCRINELRQSNISRSTGRIPNHNWAVWGVCDRVVALLLSGEQEDFHIV